MILVYMLKGLDGSIESNIVQVVVVVIATGVTQNDLGNLRVRYSFLNEVSFLFVVLSNIDHGGTIMVVQW